MQNPKISRRHRRRSEASPPRDAATPPAELSFDDAPAPQPGGPGGDRPAPPPPRRDGDRGPMVRDPRIAVPMVRAPRIADPANVVLAVPIAEVPTTAAPADLAVADRAILVLAARATAAIWKPG